MACFHKRPLARFTTIGLGSLALLPFPSFADTPAGRIMFVHGDATIERNGQRLPAERGDEFFAGDTFHTAQASTLQLRYSDGGTKAIRPDSSYILERYVLDEETPDNSAQSGELLRGGLRSITGAIGKNAPQNVTHRTPVATIGIRGTSFQILHVPEGGTSSLPGVDTGSYFYVESGMLAMSTNAGETLIRPGQVFFTPSLDTAPQLVPGGIDIFEQLDNNMPQGEDTTAEASPVPTATEEASNNPGTSPAGTSLENAALTPFEDDSSVQNTNSEYQSEERIVAQLEGATAVNQSNSNTGSGSTNGVGNGGTNNDVGNSGTNNGAGNSGTNNDVGNSGTNNGDSNSGTNNGVGNSGTNNGVGNSGTNNDVGNSGTNNGAGNSGTNNGVGNSGTNNDVGNSGTNNGDSNDDVGNGGTNNDIGSGSSGIDYSNQATGTDNGNGNSDQGNGNNGQGNGNNGQGNGNNGQGNGNNGQGNGNNGPALGENTFISWIDFEPTRAQTLVNVADREVFEELYLQNITPSAQGTYPVNSGEIVWGYWKSGTEVPASVDGSTSLDKSIVFIAASDEISDSLSASLSESALNALRDQLETGVTFNWVGGTGLVPSDGGDIIPILPNSSIMLSNSEGVQVEILLDGFGRLLGSNQSDAFSLDGINLTHEACGDSNCFEGGKFNGRYIGEEAATIMSLIEAWGEQTGDYSGPGIFVRLAQ